MRSFRACVERIFGTNLKSLIKIVFAVAASEVSSPLDAATEL